MCWCATGILQAASGAAVEVPTDLPDDIVVTARKIPEPLDQVPLAIRVLRHDDLQRAGIDGLQALADLVPGLYFESSYGGSGSAPTLRGQAQPNQSGGNVGVFVDGVYQANNTALDVPMLDLERVEIVKGPQSSLYGRSTFSGAINYVTRRPTESPVGELHADAGSDGYRRGSVVVSGPLASSGVLLRAAVSADSFDGTGVNQADPQHNLGGQRKTAASLAASYSVAGWDLLATIRHTEVRLGQPAVSALTAPDYNCGSRRAGSEYWTFYCGSVPLTTRYDLSPGVPDSPSRTSQYAVSVNKSAGDWSIENLASLYRSSSDVYRDFDSSSVGGVFGVCTVAATCDLSGGVQPVSRLLDVNQVTHDGNSVEEVSEELRVRYRGGAFSGVVGALVGSNRSTTFSAIGAAPGGALGDAERLTVAVPGFPGQVGPLSILNRFLVADPNRQQVIRFDTEVEHQHFSDVFAAADMNIAARLTAHAEVRVGLFDSNSATTPRVSLDYRLAANGLLWVSVAEGQNKGGSNFDPTLLATEQRYGPESNWTYEVGVRGPAAHVWIQLEAAVFYIDWRNTQVAGPANSPGDHNFILRNLSGIETRGAEVAADLRFTDTLRATLAYSYDDARFKRGSEDIGGSSFCGLQGGNISSSFCTLGPARYITTGDAPLVPYVDGNRLLRSPLQQWSAALHYERTVTANGMMAFGRVGLTHQGSVYFRSIDGGSSGERTLLGARVGLTRGPWTLDLWGSNLTNAVYAREVDSRGPAFFPLGLRPHDLLYGDARRVGAGLSFRF